MESIASCAVCNRTSKTSRPLGAIGSVTLLEIQEFLQAENSAAAHVTGDCRSPGRDSRALTAQLGVARRTKVASPRISSGTELLMRLTA